MGKKKQPESELITICHKYGLTPAQRKGIETILEAPPLATQGELAEHTGVTRETFCRWMHKRQFLDAMHDICQIMIEADWPMVIRTGLRQAKAGDVQWAKWLGELSGNYEKKSSVEHSGGIEHTGSIDIGDWNKDEAREAIRLIRDIKTGRSRTANLN